MTALLLPWWWLRCLRSCCGLGSSMWPVGMDATCWLHLLEQGWWAWPCMLCRACLISSTCFTWKQLALEFYINNNIQLLVPKDPSQMLKGKQAHASFMQAQACPPMSHRAQRLRGSPHLCAQPPRLGCCPRVSVTAGERRGASSVLRTAAAAATESGVATSDAEVSMSLTPSEDFPRVELSPFQVRIAELRAVSHVMCSINTKTDELSITHAYGQGAERTSNTHRFQAHAPLSMMVCFQ